MKRPNLTVLGGILVAGTGAAILLSAFSAGYVNIQADEPLLAWMAKQASAGQVPYRDFFCVLPPGSVYGLSLFFDVFGAGLGALRLLTVLWLVGTTLVLYRIFLQARVAALWSAALALQLPALVVPFWPIPSHHWFALGLGFSALCFVASRDSVSSTRRWLAAGLLTGLAGFCMQTDGALFAPLVLLNLPFALGGRTWRRAAAFFFLGLLVPFAMVLFLLAATGSLAQAWTCLVVWPSRYYKQPGGFNDISFATFLNEALVVRVPQEFTLQAVRGFLTFLSAFALPFLGLLSLGASAVITHKTGRSWWPWGRGVCCFALVLSAFFAGRVDWTHFVLLLPMFLFVAVHEIDWASERWRPLICKTFFLLLTLWACLRWPMLWARKPPLVQDVLAIDARYEREGPAGILPSLPGVLASRLPVVYLPYGNSLYFFWAPAPPPFDWVFPPSLKYAGPGDFEKVAAFLDRNAVPYVLIRREYADRFAREPSPVSEVLLHSYKVERETPWGTLFARTSAGDSAKAAGGGQP